jgi:hypothetical protein
MHIDSRVAREPPWKMAERADLIRVKVGEPTCAGATIVSEEFCDEHLGHVVMLDPDGNEFSSRRPAPEGSARHRASRSLDGTGNSFSGGETRCVGPLGGVPAATIAAQRVAEVRDRPDGRLDLLRSSYAPPPGVAPVHLRYQRAALAFIGWQLRRGLLNPLDHECPGSPWWKAVDERLLRDTCEARSRVLGHPGPASSTSVEPSVRFARQPSPRTWYLAHNVTIVRAYLDHRATSPSARTESSGSSSTSSWYACCTPTPSSPHPGWHSAGSRRPPDGSAIPA